MTSPWLARLVLTLVGVQVGVCTAFLAEEWGPLREREETAFRRIIDARTPDGHILDAAPPVDRMRVVRPLVAGSPGSYLRVDITRNRERPQDSFPQTSAEWAALLKEARAVSPKLAAIDHPLSWEDESDFMLIPLNEQVGAFERAVLCVDLRRDPVGQAPPDYLAASAVPLHRLSGNRNLLPRVNRVVFHPSVSAAPNILVGFRNLESLEAGETALPAFARWNDLLIPSFPVAFAMARHRVNPAEVEIVLGSHVRLGNGPIISIDEFGRILLPQDDAGRLLLPTGQSNSYTTAEEVIDGDFTGASLSGQQPAGILFTDAAGTAPSPWDGPAALQNVTNAIDSLPQPGEPVAHPRYPVWIETLFLAVLAALGAAALGLSPVLRNFAGPLVVLAGLGLVATLLVTTGSWTLFTPVLTCTVLTWALGTILMKRASLTPDS